MGVRPGYKQADVGVIPEDWEINPLCHIGSITAGGTPSRSNPRYWNGSVPWVTTSKVDFNTITTADQFITEEGLRHSAARLLPAGTLLVALYGQGKTRGKTAVLGIEAATNQACAAIELGACQCRDFIFHFLAAHYQTIRNLSNTGNQENLTKAILGSFPIASPSQPREQRAIARALGDPDALLAGLEQLIAKKRNLKRAVMQQLLSGMRRLPRFSLEWQAKRFGDLAAPRRERVDPRKTPVEGVCVELEHIERDTGRLAGVGFATHDSSLKTPFRPGDVLFGKLRSYLRKFWLADRNGVCSTEFWVLVANRGGVTPEYLTQVVRLDGFSEVAGATHGTHMPRSDWNVVKNWQVALPPPDEQAAIAAVLSDMDAEIEALEQRLAKTRALKQGMMQELLTGRTRLV